LSRDTLHDYRPDPTFEIVSHLSTVPRSSRDDSVITSMRSLAAANNLLAGYHLRFCETDLADVNADIPCWRPDPLWAALPVAEKRAAILQRPWEELLAVLRARCTRLFSAVITVRSVQENTTLAGRTVPVNRNEMTINFEVEYKRVRPYIEAIYRLCPNWFLIKDYFHDEKAITLPGGAAKPAVRNLKTVMVAFVMFRNFYVNGMLQALRARLNITHKMVGSLELNSDYDVTIGGRDDVPAVHEFHRAFLAAWGVESAKLFDTNVYFRDWMVVIDQTLFPSARTQPWTNRRSDRSIQVQVLDFIGDLYSLVKIRRYTSHDEWAAFVEATMRQVEVPGLARARDIPRFHRLELVDEIYRTQFCRPLLARMENVQDAFLASAHGIAMIEAGKVPRDDELLNVLFEFDKDSVLTTMRIAYVELGAKLRSEEARIARENAGTYVWRQNDDWGAVVPVEAPYNLQGMVDFLERSSLLLSEAVLFANEAYNTQGSMWTVVGGQGGTTPENLSLEHFLQSFNEQVGDALKELQEHIAQIEEAGHELEEARDALEKGMTELDAANTTLADLADNAAAEARDHAEGLVRDAVYVLESAVDAYTEAETKAANTKFTGFYRASKYEGRMREMLQRIVDDLTNEPSVRRRIEITRKMFPGKNNPDSQDLMLLTKECLMAGFFDKYVQQLLLIRKGKDSYFDANPRHLRGAASDRLREDLGALKQILDLQGRILGPRARAEYERYLAQYNEVIATLQNKRRVDVRGRAPDATKEIIGNALADPLFKAFRDNRERDVAAIRFRDRAIDDPVEGDPAGGLRYLVHHLLWHCAMVNKLYRKIRSRGPVDLYVRTFEVASSTGTSATTPVAASSGAPPIPASARPSGSTGPSESGSGRTDPPLPPPRPVLHPDITDQTTPAAHAAYGGRRVQCLKQNQDNCGQRAARNAWCFATHPTDMAAAATAMLDKAALNALGPMGIGIQDGPIRGMLSTDAPGRSIVIINQIPGAPVGSELYPQLVGGPPAATAIHAFVTGRTGQTLTLVVNTQRYHWIAVHLTRGAALTIDIVFADSSHQSDEHYREHHEYTALFRNLIAFLRAAPAPRAT
jgi:exonuclease VII small subunit